ncbi:MAG: tocopherol cyclase, partial [Moorea sp. SIO4A1]|uniref:tocopherol cyclase family protein n=1 Tax=Moorena sp. SIO4A1 TaxID=2607835 RepID=UPI00144C502D
SEAAALIGIHYEGKFYEFVPWNSEVSWQIEPWGNWQMQGRNGEYEVELTGTTDYPGTPLLAPTEQGLNLICRDTMQGNLKLELKQRRGDNVEPILIAESKLCGLEVGGIPWQKPWNSSAKLPWVL